MEYNGLWMKAGFRKAHMRAFCYSIHDINYR